MAAETESQESPQSLSSPKPATEPERSPEEQLRDVQRQLEELKEANRQAEEARQKAETEKKQAEEKAKQEEEEKEEEKKKKEGQEQPGGFLGFLLMIFAAIGSLFSGGRGEQQPGTTPSEEARQRQQNNESLHHLQRVASIDKTDEQYIAGEQIEEDKAGVRISDRELLTGGKLNMARVTNVLGFNPDKNHDGQLNENELKGVKERTDDIAAFANGNEKVKQALADFNRVVSEYSSKDDVQVAGAGAPEKNLNKSLPTNEPQVTEQGNSRGA